jgi:hypothetical protein
MSPKKRKSAINDGKRRKADAAYVTGKILCFEDINGAYPGGI